MRPDPSPASPVCYGTRDGTKAQTSRATPTTRSCSVCQAGTVPARARYCSDACKQRAYRLRRAASGPPDLTGLPATPRPRQALVAHTVYECPVCETRLLGERRCPDCHLFC